MFCGHFYIMHARLFKMPNSYLISIILLHKYHLKSIVKRNMFINSCLLSRFGCFNALLTILCFISIGDIKCF